MQRLKKDLKSGSYSIGMTHVAWKHVGAQSKLAIICQLNGFFIILKRQHYHDGSKDLLSPNPHLLGDMCEDCWCKKVALSSARIDDFASTFKLHSVQLSVQEISLFFLWTFLNSLYATHLLCCELRDLRFSSHEVSVHSSLREQTQQQVCNMPLHLPIWTRMSYSYLNQRLAKRGIPGMRVWKGRHILQKFDGLILSSMLHLHPIPLIWKRAGEWPWLHWKLRHLQAPGSSLPNQADLWRPCQLRNWYVHQEQADLAWEFLCLQSPGPGIADIVRHEQKCAHTQHNFDQRSEMSLSWPPLLPAKAEYSGQDGSQDYFSSVSGLTTLH